MDFKESLKKLRSMSDEEVVTMVEKATGKALVSYEGIDALIAALMGFYNGELKKKSPTGHKHAKEDITNFPSSMPPTAHTHDDRYYTEGEINNKLSTKVNTSDIVDNLTDNSQNKALSARQGKILNDNKSDKADEWRIKAKVVGNTSTTTDINTILENGFYTSNNSNNLWVNTPNNLKSFELTVNSILNSGTDYTKPWFYKTQIIKSHVTNEMFMRTIIPTATSSSWGPWQQIAMLNPDGSFEIRETKIIAGSYNYGFTCKNQNGTNIYSLFISDKDKRLHLGKDNAIPITLDASDVKIQNRTVWHSGNFNPYSKLNISGGTISGALTVTGNIATNGTANVKGVLTANDVYLTSDRRAKTNLKIIDNPLEKIKKINGYTFDWIKTKEKSSGVIAQEIEEILPSIVYDKGEGKKVNYNGIIALLVESNKELLKRIEVLESKVR